MYSISDSEENILRPDPDDDTEYIGSPKLIAIIGDEDTCCGFVLGGIGEVDEYGTPNYFVVDQKTDDFKLEKAFQAFLRRPDIGLVLITKEASEKISFIIKQYKGVNPVVMIIPGHNGPYEVDLPAAVKELEEKRKASGSRRGSNASTTSIKQTHSHMSPRGSTNSMKSIKSLRIN